MAKTEETTGKTAAEKTAEEKKKTHTSTSVSVRKEVWGKFKAICYLKSLSVSEQSEKLFEDFVKSNPINIK